jgi:hypothetical protein
VVAVAVAVAVAVLVPGLVEVVQIFVEVQIVLAQMLSFVFV